MAALAHCLCPMDMSIVNEVVEERQDDKEYAEEQQNDEKETENDREEKF